MMKFILEKKLAKSEARLAQANLVIKELLSGLDCKDIEIRALIRDTATSYLETLQQNDLVA